MFSTTETLIPTTVCLQLHFYVTFLRPQLWLCLNYLWSSGVDHHRYPPHLILLLILLNITPKFWEQEPHLCPSSEDLSLFWEDPWWQESVRCSWPLVFKRKYHLHVPPAEPNCPREARGAQMAVAATKMQEREVLVSFLCGTCCQWQVIHWAAFLLVTSGVYVLKQLWCSSIGFLNCRFCSRHVTRSRPCAPPVPGGTATCPPSCCGGDPPAAKRTPSCAFSLQAAPRIGT